MNDKINEIMDGEYFDIGKDTVDLDGHYTCLQLEALISSIGNKTKEIPTICLEPGTHMMRDIWVSNSVTGVSIAETKVPSKTGADHTPECFGKSEADIGVVLNLVATDPECFEVLIDKLRQAQKNFGSEVPPALHVTTKDMIE